MSQRVEIFLLLNFSHFSSAFTKIVETFTEGMSCSHKYFALKEFDIGLVNSLFLREKNSIFQLKKDPKYQQQQQR